MSGKFVRASKYRHVFGQAAKKELCYENLKITNNAFDSNIIQTNGKYLLVNWDALGGGAFAVIPLTEVGKAPDQVSLFRGHKGPVLDTAFDPFDDSRIVLCSDDGKILVWKIPKNYSFHKWLDENDEIKDITEPEAVLLGHQRKVGKVLFHPTAQNVLASLSLDYLVKIWNLETGKDIITLQHKDLVTSFDFNYNGTLLATTSRDKKLRIWDIREGKVLSEGPSHTGAKPSRVAWMGQNDRVVTTGFSRLLDRQIGLWDVNDIEKGPLDMIYIDSLAGVLIPHFDELNLILYLAGKGDGNIRYYEWEDDVLYDISEFGSRDPQRGIAALPKHSLNLRENEVSRFYKTVLDLHIEPILFIVPRRSELFQSDIYPDCPSKEPAQSADDFFDGKTVNGPLLLNLEAVFDGTEPEIKESPVKKEKEEKEPVKKEEKPVEKKETKEVKEQTPTPSASIPNKNVDELLKSSSLVNSLLDKVNNASDNEEVTSVGDEWEEVQKPVAPKAEPKKEEPKKEEPKREELKKEEPKKEEPKKEEPKVEIRKEEPKVELKKELKTTIKEDPKAEVSKATEAETKTKKAPTLSAVVEKLHGLVEKLEGHLATLEVEGAKKDERIAKLEEKVEALLKK